MIATTHHFAGVAGRNPSSNVGATIRTPDWQPRLNTGTFLYDWVMEHGSDGGVNPWVIQVGWITGGGAPKVAVYAYVGGPGGWSSYVELPSVLVFGSDHAYAVTHRVGNWWDVYVDGNVVASYNVPSVGGVGLPQAMVETDDPAPQIPDLRTADIALGADDLYIDSPFTCPASGGDYFYARTAA